MSFQPVVPLPGVAGWRFLERTQAKQQAAFENGAEIRREIAYFEENIAAVKTAGDLVADRRLLKVALAAFGLETELDKKAFVRKVLEEGTTAEGAMATRLTDPAWRKLSAAFGFGDAGARTGEAGFAAQIVVGLQDPRLRGRGRRYRQQHAAGAELPPRDRRRSPPATAAAGTRSSARSRCAQVVEKAFGLPSQFSQIDIDKQVDTLKDRATGCSASDTLTVFQDKAAVDKLIDRFLARTQIENGATASGPAANALTLLRGMTSSSGSSGLWNLLASKGDPPLLDREAERRLGEVGLLGRHVVDRGGARSFPERVDHHRHLALRPGDQRRHRAVALVPDPAGHPDRLGLRPRPGR